MLGSAVWFGVTEVVGAKLECQFRRALNRRNSSYCALQTCYCDHVLIDTSHVSDVSGVPNSRFCVLGKISGVPQLHGSESVGFDDDVWVEPIHGYCFSIPHSFLQIPCTLSPCK